MKAYELIKEELSDNPKTWLITGVAGFIGSSLLELLLMLNQRVVGLDNFSTGYRDNLDHVLAGVSAEQAGGFHLVEGDIKDLATCRECCRGVNIVLHQAALASVPGSIADPEAFNRGNIDGFLNVLLAARDAGVRRLVYASSSAVYGDGPGLPKREDMEASLLSPYALTKYVDELYAGIFARCYGMQCIGLRYFNIFGPRQDPYGAYAAVIPRWFDSLSSGEPVYIYGDGETSRDFCYIDNVVQANLLAGCTDNQKALGQVYNIACGESITLNELFRLIREEFAGHRPEAARTEPVYRDFRPGDVRHSVGDIKKAVGLLGYSPLHSVGEGIKEAASWYLRGKKQGHLCLSLQPGR